MRPPPRSLVRAAAAWLTALAGAVAILGAGPRDWWLCDLLANLRLHALVSMFALIPVLLFLGNRRFAAVAGSIALGIAVLSFQPLARTAAAGPSDPNHLTVVSYNLSMRLRAPSRVRRYLEDVPADVVVLQEYTWAWHDELTVLSDRFPYAVIEPRPGPFGIALFSRVPLVDAEAAVFPGTDVPFIAATVAAGGREFSLIGLHLDWPMFPSSFAARNAQIGFVIDRARAPAFVACGDWNTTPWSSWYRKLEAAGLHDGRPANRLQPTWPARLGWLGIPIDHCFASGDVRVGAKRVGPRLGSDHRPILVGFSLR